MNQLTFDPFTSLPACDICGAVSASIVTERDSGHAGRLNSHTITSTLTFACGAKWVASIRGLFETRGDKAFPNGDLAAYDSRFGAWTEVDECSNAAKILRLQRAEMKEGR